MNKQYAKNEVVFRQGDAADSMYEIIAGSVGIYVNYGQSDEKLLTTLAAGSTFGEMGMIEDLPRSATAVALEDNTALCAITMDSFADYFQGRPDKAFAVMRHMSMRIRALTEDYMDACRTITEMNEEAAAKSRPEGLLKRIEKYINDYANKQVSAFAGDIEGNSQLWT